MQNSGLEMVAGLTRSLRAPMGSRSKASGGGPGGKALEAPGFYSIFNVKYCLDLFYFNKILPIGKKVSWTTPTPL